MKERNIGPFHFRKIQDFLFMAEGLVFFWNSMLDGFAFLVSGWINSRVIQPPVPRGISETVGLDALVATVAFGTDDTLIPFFPSQQR